MSVSRLFLRFFGFSLVNGNGTEGKRLRKGKNGICMEWITSKVKNRGGRRMGGIYHSLSSTFLFFFLEDTGPIVSCSGYGTRKEGRNMKGISSFPFFSFLFVYGVGLGMGRRVWKIPAGTRSLWRF